MERRIDEGGKEEKERATETKGEQVRISKSLEQQDRVTKIKKGKSQADREGEDESLRERGRYR